MQKPYDAPRKERSYTDPMELTRAEVDEMLRRADEARTKLRRATRELQEFGEQVMTAREAGTTTPPRDTDRSPDADRSQ